MAEEKASRKELMAEISILRQRLREAEETLEAIRNGEVDALVVSRPEGDQIFTLKSADYSYRILVETINEGAATLNPDGHIIYANRQFAEMLQTSLERLIGTFVCDYVEAADMDIFMALLEQGRLGGAKGEVRLRNRHGAVVPAYMSLKSFQLEEVPGAICLVVTDLSEQKRQEIILAEEKLSKAIFEQVNSVIVVVDAEGRIIRASHEAHQLHPGLLLQHFDQVLRLETCDRTPTIHGLQPCRQFSITPILKGRAYHSLDVRHFPSNTQGHLAMLLNAAPLRSSQGEIMGAVVALTDITDLKLAEEALHLAKKTLEQRVQQRTAELQSMVIQLQEEVEKRREAEESLEESEARLRLLTSRLFTAQEKERGRLALELHDDLGQSLMVLKMQLRTIQKKLFQEGSETMVSLEQPLNYINEIIERVRRLSQNLRPEILEELGLAAAVKHLFREFSGQGVQVTLDLDDIRGLFSEEAQLNIYRIFQESFSNIAKHAQASQVSVSIKRNFGHVTFQIEDNGRGYEADMNGNSAKRSLGLTALDERTRMLGGFLNIWSQKGQGTKITLVVPIQDQ